MIYFDNAATTFPKPNSVVSAVSEAITKYSANPGRAGHAMAYETAEKIYETRKEIADFFGVTGEENVVFTHNCTYAINCVIKGLAEYGCHFICSSLEHNAVVRPLETLKQKGICTYSIADVGRTDEETVANFEKCINENTRAIICTGASNVFGKRLPVKKLGDLAHRHNLVFALDGAQVGGIVDINCKRDGIDFLCIAAHKGLYAPMGTGLLICNCNDKLNTIIEGGTGNLSAVLTQPENLPERFESGTLSVPNILGLKAGLDFVKNKGINSIYTHEDAIIKMIYSQLFEMKNIILYTDLYSVNEQFVPLISFNVKGLHSEETAGLLSDNNIAVRAGYHCAVLAHKAYSTQNIGTVRIAPSVFTNKKDVKLLLNSLFQIAKGK